MQEEQNQETTGEDQIDPNLAKALAQFLSGEN